MKYFRIISTIFFCLMVFISSSSFMIGLHFCSGNIQDMAFLIKAQSCSNENMVPPCHRQESKPCCEDETIVHEGQGFKASIHKIIIAPALVFDIDQVALLISEIIPSAPLSHVRYYHYDPPLRSTDLTETFQVFLI